MGDGMTGEPSHTYTCDGDDCNNSDGENGDLCSFLYVGDDGDGKSFDVVMMWMVMRNNGDPSYAVLFSSRSGSKNSPHPKI